MQDHLQATYRARIRALRSRGLQLLCGAWLLSCSVAMPALSAESFSHATWNELLQRHVRVLGNGEATQVDYAGMGREQDLLEDYLAQVAVIDKTTFLGWPSQDQLAFLINTYNAATVALVLTEFPGIDSIRDIGSLFRSPWRRDFVSLFGERVTLDAIEHDMIRGWNVYNEPRIHFAVNCAAIGCPPLRAEAYRGEVLAQQLDDNTRLFLADRTRNYIDGNRVYVSQIFNWYEEDFEQGWQGFTSVSGFLAHYAEALDLTAAQAEALARGELAIRYLRYDWGLNQVR